MTWSDVHFNVIRASGVHSGLCEEFLFTVVPGKPDRKMGDFSVKTFSSFNSLFITSHKEVYD